VSSEVARLFDAMADSYEELEPWYEHLYATLHAILREVLAPPGSARPRALDAGCGTGFQTAILADLGYEVHGADLSGGLLAVARRRVPAARLTRADVEALPYADASFDAVTCCGSTLSFVAAPGRAIAEMARVLRPGGRLLLDCEHKWSLDLAWMLASGLAGNVLGYDVSVAQVWACLRRPVHEGFVAPYPPYAALRFFTLREIDATLEAAGLSRRGVWGVHALTNLLPSTVLHRARVPRGLGGAYAILRRGDRALARAGLDRHLANTLVVLAQAPLAGTSVATRTVHGNDPAGVPDAADLGGARIPGPGVRPPADR
jgi:SAM-dependent methyltransferase